jgi:tetratricopeptide (TPR) repeat protein
MTTISQLINDGIRYINLGELNLAEKCFTAIFQQNDQHPDSHHLLAIVYLQKNDCLKQAEHHLDIALTLSPGNKIFLNTLGSLYSKTNRLNEAKQSFQKALEAQPDYTDALYNLGHVEYISRNYLDALEIFHTLLTNTPDHSNALNNLGLVYMALRRPKKAESYFQLALEQNPLSSDYYINIANAYHETQQHTAAINAINTAITLSPNNADAYNNLATYYMEQKFFSLAIKKFKIALKKKPLSQKIIFNLGLCFHKDQNYTQAIKQFDSYLAIEPNHMSALINRGNAFYKSCQFSNAEQDYKKSLQTLPDNLGGLLGLGHLYRRLGQLKLSIEYYTKTIMLNPGNPNAHFCKALVLLKDGQFNAGWRHYEWRFAINEQSKHAKVQLDTPLWSGEPLENKTLLVIGEQGLGDIVHFSRYLNLLKRENVYIRLVCAQPVKKLIESMNCVDEIIDRQSSWQIAEDYYVYLLSLPKILGMTLENIPTECPYFYTNKLLVEKWQKRIYSDKFKIGIAWSGNPDQIENSDRSCPLSALLPIINLPSVQVFSLQKNHGAEQLTNYIEQYDVIDYTNELHDFHDTACLMQAMDLVITIDTSVAHVAGAVNTPVWTLLWFAHCWRYLQHRTDSPWYPSMRLFRQPEINDWDSVVQDVVDTLKIEYSVN